LRKKEKKKRSYGKNKWKRKMTATFKIEKIADNDYEFIGEGSKSTERTTMKRRIIKKRC